MALLSDALTEKTLDVRMIERNLFKGTVTHEDVERGQKKLSDDASNADFLNLEEMLAEVREKSVLRKSL